MTSIVQGDCVEVMAGMEPESVDAIVTDPPYGLEFMGKAWDRLVADMPNAAAWAGRRATKRMEKGTEATGPTNPWGKESTGYRGGERHGSKRCRTCGHRQFSGTPCRCPEPDWETVYPAGPPSGAVAMGRWHQQWAEAAYRVAKPGAYLLAFGGTRTVHRLACAIEDAGWIIRDTLVWAYAQGFPKSKASLKPAWEPIVMARKPGPLRELAIDACRIGTTVETWPATRREYDVSGIQPGGGTNGHTDPTGDAPAGRWPANVILTDPIFDGGIEGVVGGGEAGSVVKFVQAANIDGKARTGGTGDGVTLGISGPKEALSSYGDTGTYSRFFLIPKADRADREPVLGGLPERDAKKWNGSDGHKGVGDTYPDGSPRPLLARRNVHPTVKPTDLMRHLVRLVTPFGGTVLDPFLGSGTTALACEAEGFAWVGIEKDAESVAIARARLPGTQRGLGLA